MQVVIDIDENVFTRLFDNGTEDYEIANDDLFAIAKAIRKGTPLPKRHGRLVDGDYLYEMLKSGGVENCKLNGYLILQVVKNEPTILEGTNNDC